MNAQAGNQEKDAQRQRPTQANTGKKNIVTVEHKQRVIRRQTLSGLQRITGRTKDLQVEVVKATRDL